MERVQSSHQISKASTDVAEMFNRISHRYDLANSILSLGIHHFWRRALVNLLPPAKLMEVLDLCTGTGDLLPILAKRFASDSESVIGADFSQGMLKAGLSRRMKTPASGNFPTIQATALNLPFNDNTFDLVSVAFGVRNFENLKAGLSEIQRVLKPGGTLLVLEFGQPKGIFGQTFKIYSKYLIPFIGGLLTGNRAAYEYLPKTSATFPCGVEFEKIMGECGLVAQKTRALTFGTAYAYSARKL